MPRTLRFEVPVDTGFFTPVQLQPRTLTSLAWNALARWLREHIASQPTLIRQYRTGLVVLGFGLRYDGPLAFLETEALDVTAEVVVRRGATRLVVQADFAARGSETRAAAVRLLLCPVHIQDPASLGATPGALHAAILSHFSADEVEAGSVRRFVPDLKASIEGTGRLLATRAQPFVMHRHLCEVADQWAWYELPCLIEATRATLALEQPDSVLRQAVSEPLQVFEAEFSRPYFSFDRGLIETRAYEWEGRPALVHQLLSGDGVHAHGVVVEHF